MSLIPTLHIRRACVMGLLRWLATTACVGHRQLASTGGELELILPIVGDPGDIAWCDSQGRGLARAPAGGAALRR
jgi:hypothetical protein